MVTVNLAPGDHTVVWVLSGYNTLSAVVNVSTGGVVTCVRVVDSACDLALAPRVLITRDGLNYVVSGELTAAVTNICTWITGLGGWRAIRSYNIMTLVSAYAGAANVGFTVSAAHIMGAVAYYGGNVASGKSLTGCSFT